MKRFEARVLTLEARRQLSRPLGRIFAGKGLPVGLKGKVYSVGDACSVRLIRNGLTPDLIVYDGRCRRRSAPGLRRRLEAVKGKEIIVENPAGGVSIGLQKALWLALEKGWRKVRVIGEEDLAALVLSLFAPLGSCIVYGQPGKGLVVVDVTRLFRKKMRVLWKSLRRG